MTSGEAASAPTRVLHVIARLNVGGPAIQAISMTRLLESRGYRTTLVRGTEDPDEGSMDDLAEQLGVRPVHVTSLRRDPGLHDLRALLSLMRILMREKPSIVHTHTAKAGTLGRVAALLAPGRSERVLVHTFHGHSLSGYFSPRTERIYLAIERFLAKRTDRLTAVSEEVRDELVEMGVAPAERFEVVLLGFDLSPFLLEDPERAKRRASLRSELGIPSDAPLVTLIARLVPIKRVDRFLRVAVRLADRADVRFLVVGDGELREALRASEEARALAERLTWEALAAGTPVVSTNVGGVASVVRDGHTGLLAGADDEQGLAEAIAILLDDARLAERLSTEGRRHALQSFGQARLVDDLDGLYRRLLADR
jgi:glycosyltransferase involved in cell wall biosynthesis